MDTKTFVKIKNLKENLKVKLKKERKTLKWFWEKKILDATGLSYMAFTGQTNGHGGDLNKNVESIINNYLNEKF